MTHTLKSLFAALLLALLWFCSSGAYAESQVFELRAAKPTEVLATVRSLYGDQLRAELINQRLVVVGSKQQLGEVEQLIEQLDRLPAPLRLTLSETPPVDEIAGFTVHSTATMQQIDTVEGANVAVESSRFGERANAAGWWVAIEEVPVQIDSLMLRVDPDGRGGLQVTYSFMRHENGERRVFGNRVRGTEGVWIPLLPRVESATPEPGSKVYSTAQRGPRAQLYLRVEKLDAKR